MVTKKQLANLKPCPFTSETGSKAQPKSVDKRKENRTIREIYEEKLAKSGRKGNIVEAMIAQAEAGNIAAYDRVIRDLQEESGAKGVAQSVIQLVVSAETADKLSRL